MLCGINSANESIEVENEKRNLYQRKYGGNPYCDNGRRPAR